MRSCGSSIARPVWPRCDSRRGDTTRNGGLCAPRSPKTRQVVCAGSLSVPRMRPCIAAMFLHEAAGVLVKRVQITRSNFTNLPKLVSARICTRNSGGSTSAQPTTRVGRGYRYQIELIRGYFLQLQLQLEAPRSTKAPPSSDRPNGEVRSEGVVRPSHFGRMRLGRPVAYLDNMPGYVYSRPKQPTNLA